MYYKARYKEITLVIDSTVYITKKQTIYTLRTGDLFNF